MRAQTPGSRACGYWSSITCTATIGRAGVPGIGWTGSSPALLLIATGGIDDRLEGPDADGDDYPVKPFAFELHPREFPLLEFMLRHARGIATRTVIAAQAELTAAHRPLKGGLPSAKDNFRHPR